MFEFIWSVAAFSSKYDILSIAGILEQQDISLKEIQSFLVKLDPYHEVDLLRIPVTHPEMTFDNIENGKVLLLKHLFLVY